MRTTGNNLKAFLDAFKLEDINYSTATSAAFNNSSNAIYVSKILKKLRSTLLFMSFYNSRSGLCTICAAARLGIM